MHIADHIGYPFLKILIIEIRFVSYENLDFSVQIEMDNESNQNLLRFFPALFKNYIIFCIMILYTLFFL